MLGVIIMALRSEVEHKRSMIMELYEGMQNCMLERRTGTSLMQLKREETKLIL